MSDSFEITLHDRTDRFGTYIPTNVLDNTLEKTKHIWFKTPSGKEVNYIPAKVLDKIRTEIEQLPTKTRTNWDGCCPDIDYPEIEYVDVTKAKLLGIIDKYRKESECEE